MHLVAILALEGVAPFDVASAQQVLAGAPDLGAVRYQVEVCGRTPGPVATAAGFDILLPHGLEAVTTADTIVVAGADPPDRPVPDDVLDALRAAAAHGARMVSICTGTFVLAAAGLLDGRPATTHWRYAGDLAARYPAVRVDPAVLFIDDGDVLTSAGVAAGIDLCLHLVRADHGAEVAAAAARRTVVAPHRVGGQAQYIDSPLPAYDQRSLGATRAWALEHLHQPLTLDELARHAAMSRRSFTRRFTAETGTSPLQWLLEHRVAHARRLLETSDEPLQAIARRCGFGSVPALREHFTRRVGTTPSSYRLAFRTGDPSGCA